MSETVYKEFSSAVVVWKYFLNAENSQTAQCKLCKTIIKTTGRSTKGMHVHLKSKHAIDTKLQDSDSSSTTTRPPPPSSPVATTSAFQSIGAGTIMQPGEETQNN
ncbi:hypothetical protein O0L34_g19208 [Tuta absoluta]|nr:hypothetical protein O0L34_g19208 [Tuta absoluta]